MAAAMSAVCASVALARPVAIKPATKATKATPFVSNGTIRKTSAMMVWTPIDNKYFETFSYLPPLTDGEIARQVDYMIANNYTPCLEFSDAASAYVNDADCVRFSNGGSVTYQTNRYWTMWKLPMFGCQDGNQVLREISNCTRAFPDAYIRLVAFDSVRQVQVSGFLVHRPASVTEWKKPSARSV